MNIAVRPMMREDVADACRILNQIFEIGGTTAFEIPMSQMLFAQHYLHGVDKICCHVAVDRSGIVAGFQWLGAHDDLPEDCADVATFARQKPVIKGVGRALFAATADTAGKLGFRAINATIRADNAPGLSYYDRMGFQDHSVKCGVPLRDGTPVGRISKRYDIKRGTGC